MISTKGRYALRVMTDLASQSPDRFVPLNEIAERQNISLKYLEIIIKVLVKNNVLSGQRGKGGGYKLTRTPSEYTVREILELAEGTLAPVACLSESAEVCPQKDSCATISMWSDYYKMILDFFTGITIQDLLTGDYSDKL